MRRSGFELWISFENSVIIKEVTEFGNKEFEDVLCSLLPSADREIDAGK